MTKDQVLSLIRKALTAAGSILAFKGLTADQATAFANVLMDVVGGVLFLWSVVWSLVHHKAPPTDVPDPTFPK